ncbi:MAG TPA: hypothetical protein VGM77_07250 [Gemmatimonadales bacterium]|jgi:hypothetical protein
MSDAVRRIADAVLYEGYLLWPYRRSAPKNQQRFNFGCVMPPTWSAEHPDEGSQIATQLLIDGTEAPQVSVTLRFLQVVHRQITDQHGDPVDALTIDGETHLSWDEATEREISGTGRFTIAAGARTESLGQAAITHAWQMLSGDVSAEIERLGPSRHRLSIVVHNTTPGAAWREAGPGTDGALRTVALNTTFCSAHLVLRATRGAFVSPLDAGAATACHHERLWPVLVGDAPDQTTVLAAAIMLDEYPQVAPESPGDLFDGGEVDQLLTLNILGMTDIEKAEMRASDPRARAILERTEAMTASDLMRLHGTFRDTIANRGMR